MDSKDRDESKIRQRDEKLARRMGEALDQLKPHGAGECPDAEVIAAYAEQALGPAESTQWESHFATCDRCRKILRVLAASADTPLAEKEVAQLGELISAARAPVELRGKSAERARPRFLDWRTRWLAPALAAAAVLAVWFAMRPPWRTMDRGATGILVAQAPKEEMPPSPAPAGLDQLSRVAPKQDQKAQTATPSDRSSANAQSFNSPAEGLAKGRADAGNAPDRISQGAGEATSSLQQEKKLSAPPDGREIQPPAIPPTPSPSQEAKAAMGTPAPTPLPQARAEAGATASPAPAVPTSTSQSVTVTESAPQVETTDGTLGGTIRQEPSANLPVNGRNFNALITLRPAPEYSALLKAPSGSTLWRAGKGGRIEHSADAGRTWVPQKSPSQEDWLAGAVVSEKVCWLVGRNGAIARTMDGENWERIAPPAQAAATAGKPADFTGITARDAQTATIAASDGRKFATADGGMTWKPQ